MIVLSAKNLSKLYGAHIVLQDVSFSLNGGDRVGIIGINGAGKTTLLDILTGRSSPDKGELFVAPALTTGYLRQDGDFNSERTVYEEMLLPFRDLIEAEREAEALAAEIARRAEAGEDAGAPLRRYDRLTESFRQGGGYSYKSEIAGILSSMAFPEPIRSQKVSLLSGGERTRLALAALLLKKPKLLFLDEPTNHLDIGTLAWLEQYLENYAGSIVLVSHDRYFLDRTVNRIFEMENGRLTVYEGNYTAFAEKKRAKRQAERDAYEKQRREIERQEEIVRRFRQHGTEKLAKRARSREKRLSHMPSAERPADDPAHMRIRFHRRYKSGNDVLLAEGLSKGFAHAGVRRELFAHVDLDLKSGEHVCMVGANGIGKSTLLKILSGALAPDDGRLQTGRNVLIGRYDQERALLSDENTVLEEAGASCGPLGDTELRGILGRFLFTGDTVFRKVGVLSGGERARLSLLKLMLSGANLLLLDEPTNHLDIVSKEVFEEALRAYAGTALIVSHDRYFLNRIPSRIVELTRDGLVNYLGGYDHYAERKEAEAAGKRRLSALSGAFEAEGTARDASTAEAFEAEDTGISDAAEQRRRSKAAAAAEKRRLRALALAEERIAALEDEIGAIEAEMCDAAVLSDHVLLRESNERLSAAKDALAAAYDRWMELVTVQE
ncbi:MAG: ABC-F family ATP-binding cassette domain-containing protein [Clostridiales Family XIII bacterium]|jgi:ATP-binding cassette subfamily F protein 3|nr:ABC-F family ATP-binding cassette domain-containing protein [Clostridiales Family XIII bacterium]